MNVFFLLDREGLWVSSTFPGILHFWTIQKIFANIAAIAGNW